MIATFPDPYDGELFYSVLARFAERMNYPARHVALRELFGGGHGVPAVELPNKIDALVKQLPPGNLYSSDAILQKHTLLPFYAPFLPQRNFELIVANMKGDGHRTTQLRAGIIAGRISPPEFFRSCPACDKENLARCGEAYWHRLHQIKGVEVCPVHSVFLENSNVRLAGSTQKDALFSAESAQRGMVARVLNSGKAEDRFLLRLAKSAAWLLDQTLCQPGLVEISHRHRNVLRNRDCLTPRGWLRLNRLREKLREWCTPELLKRFNCELTRGSDGGWLARLFRETDQATAPLRHLVVMAVLEVSAEEFFTPLLSKSARRPPVSYPCLNAKCSQFGALVIPNYELKRTNFGYARIFQCPHCGHRASRSADGRSVIRVVSFGQVWLQQLKSLWADSSRSVDSISAELGADARSVTKHAARLGLTFPRQGPTKCAKLPNSRVVKRPPPALSVDRKREAWRCLRETNPHATISELHEQAQALYTWLYRHDRQWLREHSPTRQPLVPQITTVDWKARDADLADRVISAATRLKSNPDRRRRVTSRSIALAMGLHPLLKRGKWKLPRTRLALESQIESTEQFALFRIRRALNFFVANRKRATHSDLLRATGITGSTVNQLTSVRQALTDAKEALDRSLDSVRSSMSHAA
jgi:hypothetical protein